MFSDKPLSLITVVLSFSLTNALTWPMGSLSVDESILYRSLYWITLLGTSVVSIHLCHFLWDILPLVGDQEPKPSRQIVVTRMKLGHEQYKYIIALEGVCQMYTYDLDKAIAMAVSTSNTHGVTHIKYELGKF